MKPAKLEKQTELGEFRVLVACVGLAEEEAEVAIFSQAALAAWEDGQLEELQEFYHLV